MKGKNRQLLFGIIFSAALCVIYFLHPDLPAYAQMPPQADVDRATREVDRSVREEAEEKLIVPPKKPSRIKEEEEIKEEPEVPKFFVRKINLVGVVSVSPEEFQPLLKKYENRNVSLEELNILAREIEREYLRKGIIAACFIPPQDIKEGVVTLQVVEARMGELTIKDHSFFDKERVASYWTIRPGEVLRYDEMSRSIQLMNKNPDREVRATLHAGKKRGTTDVLLDVKTHFPVHVFFSFDREGSVSTGRERTGFGIKDNNFLFADDTLLTGSTVGKDFTGVYAYHSVPITNFGTSIMYGYNYSRSAPKKEYEAFGIRSRAENTSLFVYQDIYRKGEYLGEFSIGLDAKDKTTTSDTTGTINRDRLRIARLKNTFIHRYPGCVTYISPQFSQGLNILGARRKSDLSSRGAGNVFSKFNLGIRHKRLLPLNLQASLNFKCQWASEKLAPQEEFALGGIDSVRGYPSQDYMADNGFQTNFELLIPSFWIPDSIKIPYAPRPLKEEVTGVVFLDQGYGERRGNIATEEKDASLIGIGAGLRIRLFNQALVRLEWGFPIGDKPITEAENSRFHFSVNFEDRFPEEFERIKKLMQEDSIKRLAWKLLDDEMARPDSPLRKKMCSYLTMARRAYEENNLKEAKYYYGEIQRIGESLYLQMESYVKSCIEQEKELKNYNALAMRYYTEGDIEKAKDLWQKIEKEAEIKPLILEI